MIETDRRRRPFRHPETLDEPPGRQEFFSRSGKRGEGTSVNIAAYVVIPEPSTIPRTEAPRGLKNFRPRTPIPLRDPLSVTTVSSALRLNDVFLRRHLVRLNFRCQGHGYGLTDPEGNRRCAYW